MSPDLQLLIKLLVYAVFGAVGGLIGVASKGEALGLPRVLTVKDKDGSSRRMWDPGFLMSVFLGAGIAAWRDGSYEQAIAWGLAAGFVGPALLKTLLDSYFRKLGAIGAPAPPVKAEPTP